MVLHDRGQSIHNNWSLSIKRVDDRPPLPGRPLFTRRVTRGIAATSALLLGWANTRHWRSHGTAPAAVLRLDPRGRRLQAGHAAPARHPARPLLPDQAARG